MNEPLTTGRIPRAGLDPIDSADVAQRLICELLADPPRFETLAILLDRLHRGVAVITVDGTVDDDAVLVVADRLAEMVGRLGPIGDIGGIVLVSVRPGRSDQLDDVDRWIEIDGRFDEIGVELVEWFVVGHDISCPRTLLGEPARWVAEHDSGPRRSVSINRCR